MENPKNIGDFVKELNKSSGLLKSLNMYLRKVFNALPNGSFSDLNAFVSFLPNKIKDFFASLQNNQIWKDFSIGNEDLETLYEINLEPETKTEIMKKFGMSNQGSVKVKKGERVKKAKAFSIFKKILGQDKISVSSFGRFIYNNFSSDALSNADVDDIVDYVQPTGEGDKLQDWEFWDVCDRFEIISSKKFINFMVENTDFTKSEDGRLISNIKILAKKSLQYKDELKKIEDEKEKKEKMDEAMKYVLNGNDPYQKFSEALAEVKDIETKIFTKTGLKVKLQKKEQIDNEKKEKDNILDDVKRINSEEESNEHLKNSMAIKQKRRQRPRKYKHQQINNKKKLK